MSKKKSAKVTKKKTKKKAVRKKRVVSKAKSVVSPPAVHTSSKTREDRFTNRFRDLLPDIEGITERIIETDLDHTQAMEVTTKADDLVDWAPNAISWCADKRFLGIAPFAKQCEILLHLFEEWCPRCSDNDYVRDIPVKDPLETVLTNIALLEFGKCPHCGFLKGMGREEGIFVDPTELVAPVGQRAGKSVVISQAASYLIHRNLMLPMPWKEYGLAPGQILDFTFVATTKQQSERTLWGQFKGMLTSSQWFRSYKEVCDLEGKKLGIPVTIKNLETYISFGHKSLLIYFAANDPAGLRGSTRLGSAIDELSWFGNKDGSKRSNGPETYTALNNSCLTLRGAVHKQIKKDKNCIWPMPLLFNVSSPVSMDDPLMTLYRDSAGNPRAIRKHWATWEAHPEHDMEYLTDIGEVDKPNFHRDYGAQPPLAHSPLVRRPDIVTEAFKNPLALEARYGPVILPIALGFTEVSEFSRGIRTAKMQTASLVPEDQTPQPDWATLANLSEEALEELGPSRPLFQDLIDRPPHKRMHIMGVDLGATNNALGVVCGYVASGKFITDFALEVKPQDGYTNNIAEIYEHLIVPLVDRLNVVAVFYDKWASLHQIHALATQYGSLGPLNDKAARRAWLRKLAKRRERPAFIADHYSLSMADAMMLTARLEQGDCLFPAMEEGFMDLMVNKNLDPTRYPYTHLALQMATVRVSGNRLLKPLGRDDDIFRAWANAAVPAFSNELVIDLLGQEERGQRAEGGGAQSFHVSLGQTGRGIRNVADVVYGATSTTSGTADFPVVVRKGTFRS